METVLTERWMRGYEPEHTLDEASVSVARDRVRAEGAAIGLSKDATASLVTVASELAHNQLRHAQSGRVAVRRITRHGIAGLEVVAADCGGGLEDVEQMLGTAPPRAHPASLGAGLAGVLAMADEVDFDVRLDEGTCIWARKFVAPVTRVRSIGICGRPIEGELRAGDDATFVRLDDGTIVLAVVDGLGHGPDARSAAVMAIDCVLAAPTKPLDDVLEAVSAALQRTRGAVMAVARITAPSALEAGIVGNVAVRLVGRRMGADRRYAGPSFTLGMPGRMPRMRVEHDVFGAHDALVAFTDGVSSRLSVDPELFALPPIVAARRLLDAFSDRRDDALVAFVL